MKRKWQRDDIILHYTGSMYGIGCSVFSVKSIQKIQKLKNRDKKMGLIVLLPDKSWLSRYGIKFETDIDKLMQQFWPGNLTIILEDIENQFSTVSYEGKVAFRVPASQSLRDFIVDIDEPIVSTSVNISGTEAPSSVKEISNNFGSWYDYPLHQKDYVLEQAVPSTIIDFTKNEMICLREGIIPFEMILNAYERPQILFICTANICRSPMAHYLLQYHIESKNLRLRISSAGFLEGNRAISENSELVLKENGIDASNHKSTQLSDEIVQDSWLVLTMTEQHKKMLQEKDQKVTGKVFTLLEFIEMNSPQFSSEIIDIDDPYGLDIEYYRNTYQIINSAIDQLVQFIKEIGLENE